MTSRRHASAAFQAARALVAEGRRREAASVLSEVEIEGVNDDALGLLDSVIRDTIAKRLKAERGNALSRTPNFSIPAASGGRPVTADGRTSFHLSIRHHTVDSVSTSGGNPAGNHDAYIARLGAVPDLPAQREDDAGDSGPGGSAAIQEDRYIDRPGAVASVGDAKAMWTNISDSQIEREDFWGRVEAYEQGGRPDALIFSPADNPDFWERVASREDCPDEIREALDRKSKTREIMAGARAAELLDWLRAVDGWTDASARVREGRRGGVAQHRINGEISKELNEAGRIATMSKLANVFEKMNLRYVLVVHQPDARNDPRNWHFHLIYYDRPTEKGADGLWDFERPRSFTDKSGHRREGNHAQTKDRTWTTSRGKKELRARIAAIFNEQLEDAGADRRLDPRRHKAMGIEREPQRHLGTQNTAFERAGIPTPRGYDNALIEWNWREQQIEAKRKADLAALSLNSGTGDRADREMRQAAIDLRAAADLVDLTIARQASSARRSLARARVNSIRKRIFLPNAWTCSGIVWQPPVTTATWSSGFTGRA